MKKTTKVAALVLALSMMVPVFAACAHGGGEDSISADDPWYNVTTVEIGSDIDYSQYDYSSMMYVGMYGDNFLFRLSGSFKVPDDFDYANDDFNQYRLDDLRVYDMSGNLTAEVDISGITGDLPSDCDGGYVSGVYSDDEGYYATVTGYSYSSSVDYTFMTRLDIDAGTYGSLEATSDDAPDYVDRLTAQGLSQESPIDVGSYHVDKFWSSQVEPYSYVLEVTDADGVVTEYDMRALCPSVAIFDISNIIDIGGDRGLMICSSSSSVVFFIIDFANHTISDNVDGMDWLTSKVNYIVNVEGLGTVVKDIDGIYTINYDGGCLEPLFLYSYANVNMYEVRNFTPVTITEERAIFTGDSYAPLPFVTPKTIMYVFDRADSNPNAGKSFIDVASANDYSYALCSAVCEFNSASDDYFIRFDSSYNINSAAANTSSGDSDDGSADKAATDLGNQLAIDIMSGTGPDIIINGQQFGMLNDDDYLINLSSFIADTCSTGDYFTNVFDAAKNGDELYQVPVAFKVMGIVTDSSNVDAGQIGFTFDQYADFVSGPCNGSAPIDQGKMYFFINSLDCMTDLLITDDVVEFDSDAFRALAEFTSDNVNEVLQTTDDDDMGNAYPDQTAIPAMLVTVTNISTYFDTAKNGDRVMLGIPSYDGRGPIIVGSDSVAISSQTEAPDACRDFVTTLLGENVQEAYGLDSGIPVNRAAFADVGSQYSDYQNARLESAGGYYTPAQMRAEGINPDPIEASDIDDFASFIGELTGWYTNDGSINAIIREEMPAYFEGQKTLDQVIPVLEDRIQTLLNERG